MQATRLPTHFYRVQVRSDTVSSGLVLLCAAVTSIIGCAYTSVSFLKTFSKTIANNEKWFIVGFIALSTVVMALIGQPATLLVLAGALNGLILLLHWEYV